jgi:hypothetical protein
MNWITDLIALGDFNDSVDPQDVDAVLNVAAEAPVVRDLPWLHLKIEDQQPISRRDLQRALAFLEDRTPSGTRALLRRNFEVAINRRSVHIDDGRNFTGCGAGDRPREAPPSRSRP